jgi:SH3 domain-containing YSC84-like protein 1
MTSTLRSFFFGIVLLAVAAFGWAQQSNQPTDQPADQPAQQADQQPAQQTDQPAQPQPAQQNDQQAAPQPDQETNTPPPAQNNPKPTKPAKFDKNASSNEPEVVKRLDNSANVLSEIMGTPDKGIPTKILGDAKCIIIIPSMINIAVGFGGRHGKGIATCRTTDSNRNGWSAPAPVTLTGGSWGLQLGGQAVDLVMLVMNQRGMDHLLSSKFKIGAEATGAAGPVGREVEGDTDWKMKAEILTYSRARGLFAGIDLNGASIKQDRDETAVLYSKILPFQTILSGKVAPPVTSKTFLATVRKYSSVAAEKKREG